MNVTVFYAWQSDRPGKLNHYLIRDAARDACDRITADADNNWTATLDHDTKDVPGMCDIPNEILDKIRKCDIFLADLTLIGQSDAGKPLPNANVIFELGYAAKTLTFKALIGVVNEAWGELESQVFDIKRRKALGYTAAEGISNREIKIVTEKLSKDLEGIIRYAIQEVVIPKRSGEIDDNDREVQAQRTEITTRVLNGEFHDVSTIPAIVTSVFFQAHPHIDYEKVGKAVRDQFRANPDVHPDAYVWEDDGCVCEFSLSGFFHRVCTKDSRSLRVRRASLEQAGDPLFGNHLFAQPVHRNIVTGVVSSARFLTNLGIKLPWWVTISIVGAKGYDMFDDANNVSKKSFADDIVHLVPQRVTLIEQVEDGMKAGTTLKRSLQHLTRTLGWEFNWYYTENGQFLLRIMA
ncbi:hypothetical protein NHH03_23650 [Stieleria sp. TO1_6]|uniref:hypothetical protein n=1 Tax=Stieleria tagensis TaxID=2956795 RepID=UPI00209B20E4|nr:hypothetical protein [Stieleria tagensis]MCO8124753.1 hypothetical protein [Stieleria tagensis]